MYYQKQIEKLSKRPSLGWYSPKQNIFIDGVTGVKANEYSLFTHSTVYIKKGFKLKCISGNFESIYFVLETVEGFITLNKTELGKFFVKVTPPVNEVSKVEKITSWYNSKNQKPVFKK